MALVAVWLLSAAKRSILKSKTYHMLEWRSAITVNTVNISVGEEDRHVKDSTAVECVANGEEEWSVGTVNRSGSNYTISRHSRHMVLHEIEGINAAATYIILFSHTEIEYQSAEDSETKTENAEHLQLQSTIKFR